MAIGLYYFGKGKEVLPPGENAVLFHAVLVALTSLILK
jgi:hypothetical protein